MPIYEFDCPKCGRDFEELVRSAEAIQDVACPSCGSRKVRKKMSAFASKVAGGARGATAVAASSCAPGGT